MHGVEKSRARSREARELHFCTPRRYSRIRTTNLNLMMQKGSRVVQMIIAHKSFIYFTYLKDEIKNKVALAVELSICSENKGADQLRGYHRADLRLCFRICKMLVFS